MSASNGIFLFVLTVGAGFFALNVQRLVALHAARRRRTIAPIIRSRGSRTC